MKSPFLDNYFLLGVFMEIASIALYYYVSRYFYYGGGWPFVPIFFGILYFIGSYFIFRTGIPVFLKITLVYWWVALAIGYAGYSVVRSSIESKQTVEEIYLIPEGYRGKVVVKYNQADGDPIVMEKGHLVLHVGKDGVVRTRYKRELNQVADNDTHPLHFYVNEAGNRTLIKLLDDPTRLETETVIHSGGYQFDQALGLITEADFLLLTKTEAETYYNKP